MEQEMYMGSDSHSSASKSTLLGVSALSSDDVCNQRGEKLGSIKELLVDVNDGKLAYAVLSCGGFMSLGEKLYAVPWSTLKVDTANKCLVFAADEDRLKEATGFDSDHWPNMTDEDWRQNIHAYYGTSRSDTTAH